MDEFFGGDQPPQQAPVPGNAPSSELSPAQNQQQPLPQMPQAAQPEAAPAAKAPTMDEFFNDQPKGAKVHSLDMGDEHYQWSSDSAMQNLKEVGSAIGDVVHPEYNEWRAEKTKQTVGNIAKAFFGAVGDELTASGRPLGNYPETEEWLRKNGVWNDYEKNQTSVVKGLNEALMQPLASVWDAAWRVGNAVIFPPFAGASQAAEEAGSPALARDINLLPYAFPTGIRGATGVPHAELPPQVAEARAAGVIGESEAQYFGTRERTPDQVKGAYEAAAQLKETPEEPAKPEQPDIHAMVRNMEPETFRKYDELDAKMETVRTQLETMTEERQKQAEATAPHTEEDIADLKERIQNADNRRKAKIYQNRLNDWMEENEAHITEQTAKDTDEMASIRADLQRADYAKRDLAPEVSRAYRAAQEVMPEKIEAPKEEEGVQVNISGEKPPVEEGTKIMPPAENLGSELKPADVTGEGKPAAELRPADIKAKENITRAESEKLQGAGRPKEEADAAAQLVAEHYQTRAERFGGKRGTAEEMYDRDSANIKADHEHAVRSRARELAQKVPAADAEGKMAEIERRLDTEQLNTAERASLLKEMDRLSDQAVQKYSHQVPRELKQTEPAKDELGFISKMRNVLEQKLNKTGTAEQFKQQIDAFQKAGMFKGDERFWTGLDDFLDEKAKEAKEKAGLPFDEFEKRDENGKLVATSAKPKEGYVEKKGVHTGKIDKADILDYLDKNRVELTEHGGDREGGDSIDPITDRDFGSPDSELNEEDPSYIRERAEEDYYPDILKEMTEENDELPEDERDTEEQLQEKAMDKAIEKMEEAYSEDPYNYTDRYRHTITLPDGTDVDLEVRSMQDGDHFEWFMDGDYQGDARSFDDAIDKIHQKLMEDYNVNFEGVDADNQFENYTGKGGTNYRFLRLSMPELKGGTFTQDSHYPEENVVMHMRTKDRVGPGGGKMLFGEEFQSDLHQAAYKNRLKGGAGYATEADPKAVEELKAQNEDLGGKIEEAQKSQKTLEAKLAGDVGNKLGNIGTSLKGIVADRVETLLSGRNNSYEPDALLGTDPIYEKAFDDKQEGKLSLEAYRQLRTFLTKASNQYKEADSAGRNFNYKAFLKDHFDYNIKEIDAGEQYEARRPDLIEARDYLMNAEEPKQVPSADVKSIVDEAVAKYQDEWTKSTDLESTLESQRQDVREKLYANTNLPPLAPFSKTWREVAFKRMLIKAAEEGYDSIGWTTGQQQNIRYNLSRFIRSMEAKQMEDGSFRLSSERRTIEAIGQTVGKTVEGEGTRSGHSEITLTPEQLETALGKEGANSVKTQAGTGAAETVDFKKDLEVGGERKGNLYDQMLPQEAQKILKKLDPDIKVELKDYDMRENDRQVGKIWYAPLTDKAKAALGEGVELFQGTRGKIRLATDDAKATITLMKNANASTFIHETGHHWLDELEKDAAHPLAPQDLRDDMQTVRDYLGVKEGEQITTRQHEKFARGFERYVMEGVAPSKSLADVFFKFKQWLTQIYQTVQKLRSPISDDIRDVFDRLLSSNPEKSVIAPEREPGKLMADTHEDLAAKTAPEHAEAVADKIGREADRIAKLHAPEVYNELNEKESGGENTGEQAAGEELGGDVNAPESVAGQAGVTQEPGKVGEGAGGTLPESPGPLGQPSESSGGAAGEGGGNAAAGTAGKPTTNRSETPLVDKAGNIRLENLSSSEDVRNAIRQAAYDTDDFANARRGVVTDQDRIDLANAMGVKEREINLQKLRQMSVEDGIPLAVRIQVGRQMLKQSAQESHEAMMKAATGTEQDLMDFADARQRHLMIAETIAGITAEWGRAGRAFRNISKEEMGQVQDITELFQRMTGKSPKQMQDMAKLGSSLDTPEKIAKFLQDTAKPSIGDMILECWINSKISGLATHTTYTVGNTLLTAWKAIPESAGTAIMSKVNAALGKESSGIKFGEIAEKTKAGIKSIPSGLEAAGKALKTGLTTKLPGEGEATMPLQFGHGEAGVIGDKAVTWNELGQDLFSNIRAMRDSFMQMGDLLKSDAVKEAPLMGLKKTSGAIPDLSVKGITVPVGTLIRAPGRMVAGIHSFFRAVNYQIEKAGLAYRAADAEGLTGQEFSGKVADIMTAPSDEIMKAARTGATETTLMGQGSAFTRNLNKLVNTPVNLPGFGETRLLRFIAPFINISSNVIDQALVKRTALGFLSKEVRADLLGANGVAARDIAQGRMLMGTALTVTIGGLVAEGLASGSAPSNPREAAIWRLAGNQEHSVRVGDMWYDIHRLGPLGMLISTSADLYQVGTHLGEEGMTAAASQLMHAVTQNVLDESFMRGPSDLIRAIEDHDRYGNSYVRNLVASFVPFDVGLSQWARATDPFSRQVRSVGDAIKNKIPGLSEDLWPRRDIWGEPIPNKAVFGIPGLSAIYETKVNNDPVNHKLLSLSYFPAMPERKIRGVPLSDQQYDDYCRIAGRLARYDLEQLITPEFDDIPAEHQHAMVQGHVSVARERAREMIMAQYPDIMDKAREARYAGVKGKK